MHSEAIEQKQSAAKSSDLSPRGRNTTREQSESAVKSSDLPPPRSRNTMRDVSPPLSHVTLRQFNRYIMIAAALLVAFYGWRVMKWKTDAGGWWNFALGRYGIPSPDKISGFGATASTETSQTGGSGGTVEDRINDLASALGVPSKELASAIAAAVRKYVPPASLSSVSAHETGAAVHHMLDPEDASKGEDEASTPAAVSGFGSVMAAVDAVVGQDEPLNEMD